MSETLQEAVKPSKGSSLAKSFSGLGWIGFWVQVAIGSIPVGLAIYSFAFGRVAGAGTRGGFVFAEFLALVGLLVLAFTTVWFYRYTRLAGRIADPKNRPSLSAVRRAALTGVVASTIGIVFSALVLMFEVTQLLFYFLRAPQVGIPTVQTTGAGAASWVSAADIVSLLILILILIVEIAVLALSLWLLSRAMTASMEYPDART